MISSVHPSSSSSTSFTVRELCLAAVMAAVVFLATFVPRIPIPLGYAHLGDAGNAPNPCLGPVREAPWRWLLGTQSQPMSKLSACASGVSQLCGNQLRKRGTR